MEKVCPWCGQPSDRGQLKNRMETYLSNSVYSCVTDKADVLSVFQHTVQYNISNFPKTI